MCVVEEERTREKAAGNTVGEGGVLKIRCKSNSVTRRLPDYDSPPSSQCLGRNGHISVSTYPLNAAPWLKHIRMLSGQLKAGNPIL